MKLSSRFRKYLLNTILAVSAYANSQELLNNIITGSFKFKPVSEYKQIRRLDPFECISMGISDASFKRLFRMSQEMYIKLYEELLPSFTTKHVRNNTIKGGRPHIPLSHRLGVFLYAIGRDTDIFSVAFMFGVSVGFVASV